MSVVRPGFDIDMNPELFIGGSWRSGATGGRIPVIDPSTEEQIGSVASANQQDAIAAVDAAERAKAEWIAKPPRARSEILRRCYELMIEQAESLAYLISKENGKALKDARGEVYYAAEFFRWFAEEAVRALGDLGVAPSGSNRILVQHEPIGIALLITPWNFPAAMATRKIAPALAAGCTCILKPATATPLTAFAIARILAEAGVPDGVVNVLTTEKTAAVVNTMLADPRVRKLSFTGSTEVGRVLLREAAKQVISSSMELGGNAPFIVFEDADLDEVIEGAMIAKMRNGGEACTAANRFLVHRSIAEEFTQRLTDAMSALRVGPGVNEDTDCGPMIDAQAIAKIQELVKEATTLGARIRCGGQAGSNKGFYYPPTVLDQMTPDSAMFREEIFGPVAPVYVFDSEKEAIQLANATEYGLVAYLYTRDIRRGLRISGALEAGMVALNRGLVSDPAAPFGGVKQSGLGREGAHHGMLEFMEPKYIATHW